MIRILIADDHAIVRAGLKQIIADTADLTVLGEASDGQQVLEMLEQQSYDMVVLDLSMPGRGGLDTLKQIHSLYPGLPVLILSMHPEDQYAVRALKSGASGYLGKESASEELVNAIRQVAAGRKYISAAFAQQLAEDVGRQYSEEPHKSLSDRELQILCLIASGRTVSEIADSLSLSVKTVSTYRTRILLKMNMKTNAELTHYAIANHLTA